MGARPRLTPTTRALLADVAALLAVHPEVGRLRIEGHADSSSDEAMSQRASLEWATQAAALLNELGVEPHRLQPVGVGDTQPIESNRTDEGRAANRRLELHIELSVER
jgi:outer membrane protein OmpA-like peptidoglycan-associated protein